MKAHYDDVQHQGMCSSSSGRRSLMQQTTLRAAQLKAEAQIDSAQIANATMSAQQDQAGDDAVND
jgi:hypothetical protein